MNTVKVKKNHFKQDVLRRVKKRGKASCLQSSNDEHMVKESSNHLEHRCVPLQTQQQQ